MKEFFANRLLRRIVVFMLLTEFFWGLGNFFVLMTTTLTTYLVSLHASLYVISALSVIFTMMGLMPQLFGRTMLNRFRRRKRAIILFHLSCATPYLIVPLLHRLLVPAHTGLQIGLMLGLLAFSQMAIAFAVPVWLDMQAYVIPLPLRGRYYGLSALFFAGGGVLGGLGFNLLQARFGEGALQVVFFVATGFFVLSMCMFALAPIPASAFDHPQEPPIGSRIHTLARACHPRTDFGRLVASNAMLALAGSVVPFLMAFSLDKRHGGLGYPETINGWVTIFQALGSAFGGLLLGSLVDRIGPRLPWAMVTLLIPAVIVLIPHGGHFPVLAAAFVLAGVLNTIWSVSGPAMLELSPTGDKSGYVAIANVISAVPAIFGAWFIGFSIKHWDYHTAFLFAAGFGILAFFVGLTIRARRPTGEPETAPIRTSEPA